MVMCCTVGGITGSSKVTERIANSMELSWRVWLSLLVSSIAVFALLPDGVMSLVPRRDADGSLIIGPYRSTFRCPRNKYGYYADLENDCRLFHICHPHVRDYRAGPRQGLATNRMEHYSFVCPDETIFDQSTLNCASIDHAVPCEYAVDFYFFSNNDSITNQVAEPTASVEEPVEENLLTHQRQPSSSPGTFAEDIIESNDIGEVSRSLANEHTLVGTLPADGKYDDFPNYVTIEPKHDAVARIQSDNGEILGDSENFSNHYLEGPQKRNNRRRKRVVRQTRSIMRTRS